MENCGEGKGNDRALWGEGAVVSGGRPGGGRQRDSGPSMTGFHSISIPNMPCEFLPPAPTPQTAPAVPTLSRGQCPAQKSPVPSRGGCCILGDSWGRWGREETQSWLGSVWGQEGPGVGRSGDPPGCSVGPPQGWRQGLQVLPFQAFTTLFPQTQMHTQPNTCKCCYEI